MKPPKDPAAAGPAMVNAHARALASRIPYEQFYSVDWKKISPDSRRRTHAWTAGQEYIGQFSNHEIALQNGAAVTKHGAAWFDWRSN